MFNSVEKALRKFAFEGSERLLSLRLRVLVTRVTWVPPFVMGEVIDWFPDIETSVQSLCASCHAPFFAGILPYRVGRRFYYDGLAWSSSMFVGWRGCRSDHVVRVSAVSSPNADIRCPAFPLWWSILPPEDKILRGI